MDRLSVKNDEELQDTAELFKIFGDFSRMKILTMLFEKEAISVGELAENLSVTSSAVSHQLKILRGSRLVKSKRVGKLVYYSLADDHVRTIIEKAIEHIREKHG